MIEVLEIVIALTLLGAVVGHLAAARPKPVRVRARRTYR